MHLLVSYHLIIIIILSIITTAFYIYLYAVNRDGKSLGFTIFLLIEAFISPFGNFIPLLGDVTYLIGFTCLLLGIYGVFDRGSTIDTTRKYTWFEEIVDAATD